MYADSKSHTLRRCSLGDEVLCKGERPVLLGAGGPPTREALSKFSLLTITKAGDADFCELPRVCPELEDVFEASDGLEAGQKADEL